MGCFLPKYIMFELKRYLYELFFVALNIDAKFEGELTFKNDMKNLANFHRLKNSQFILES